MPALALILWPFVLPYLPALYAMHFLDAMRAQGPAEVIEFPRRYRRRA